MPSKKTAKLKGHHRTAAIGLIVVCIVGTAILIAARSAEPTAAAVTTQPATATETATTPPVPVRTTKAPATATAKPLSGETAAKTVPAEPATIEGCLVQENESFQLKDTAGEDAPRGRSWKSGFLKKSNKSIELMDERHRLNLASHVGERVSVSGMLADRELQGSSIKRLAESCN